MSHNPLVSIDSHPMLVTFPAYMQAVEDFNTHADDLIEMVLSTSPEMASVAPEIAYALNQYYHSVKSGDIVQILTNKGAIYFLASMHGMEHEELMRFQSGLDIYMALTLILSKIEKQSIACLN